jgi:hypothetical protein
MLLEPKISWEFFEILVKIEGRCTRKEKSLHSPGSSVFLLNNEKCNQRAHEVGECKLKRLDDWSLCEVLPDVLN